ncbi:hypothetical protein RUND412_002289 [Rhizina undulata]
MNLEELGFDPSIKEFSERTRNPYSAEVCVTIPSIDHKGQSETFILDISRPIFLDSAIASRGRTAEGVFLENARDLWGVVQCIAYGDVFVTDCIDDVFHNVCYGLETQGQPIKLDSDTATASKSESMDLHCIRRSKIFTPLNEEALKVWATNESKSSGKQSNVFSGMDSSAATKRKSENQKGSIS